MIFKRKNNLKKINKEVDAINTLRDEMNQLSDDELKMKTLDFRERLRNGESRDSISVEAFAVCREASKRVLGMEHFDVQLIGGLVLHKGMIAEMKTGEGKTLVATVAAYLNALEGHGVHVVTVNDYLAKRDMEQMGKLYRFLGLTVGCVYARMGEAEKKAAYTADITYGTANEFGFDYLRDNMATHIDRVNMRGFNYAIIDEVDSVLIDEAKTPLIISAKVGSGREMFRLVDVFVKGLTRGADVEDKTKLDTLMDRMNNEIVEEEGDFIVDEKHSNTVLTDRGIAKAEKYFGIESLTDEKNLMLSACVNQSLKANYNMHAQKDYIVDDGKVCIIDGSTGRLMDGRKYSDGLHQAIEAKEGVTITEDNQAQATITLQNFFRMYPRLSGMTGTAETEAIEMEDIYGLKVVQIPTNKPIQRIDDGDRIYTTEELKHKAILDEIHKAKETGQPILIGTPSVEKSEVISRFLKKNGVRHNVLNAKKHKEEAMIIAQAGKMGAITIATNMAGRGTDILLGGNAELLLKEKMVSEGYDSDVIEIASGFNKTTQEEVMEVREEFAKRLSEAKEETAQERNKVISAGGLLVIGTARNDARRVDNQLRGRAGRQGDPGRSIFLLSLEDDLIKMFGGAQLKTMLQNTDYIDGKMLTRIVEGAQKKVEVMHFEARKATLEYDDVNQIQRNSIYTFRKKALIATDLTEVYESILRRYVNNLLEGTPERLSEADIHAIARIMEEEIKGFDSEIDTNTLIVEKNKVNGSNKKHLTEYIISYLMKSCYDKAESVADEVGASPNNILKRAVLNVVDTEWRKYICDMINLKTFVSVASHGTTKPIQIYKNSAIEMYEELLDDIAERTFKKVDGIKPRPKVELVKEQAIAIRGEALPAGEILNGVVKRPPSHNTLMNNPILEKRNEYLRK